MKAQTRSLLQVVCFLALGVLVLVSLLPSSILAITVLGPFVDRGWAHFVVYGVAATMCTLAWNGRAGIPVACSLFFVSIGLHFLHSLRSGIGMDRFSIIVNFLGIAAGILLGLNLATLRARLKTPTTIV